MIDINVYDPPQVDSLAVSDLHLGGRADLAMVLDFLEVWAPRVLQLIVFTGDTLELQLTGQKQAFRAGSQALALVLAIKQRLCRVVIQPGNHDEWIGDGIASGGDVVIATDRVARIREDPPLYITHGWQFDRSAAMFELLAKMHWRGGNWMGRIARRLDRRVGRHDKKLPRLRKKVYKLIRSLPPSSTLLTGHTHKQFRYIVDQLGRSGIDTGSAVAPPDEIGFAVEIEGEWEMLTWRKRHG